MKNKFDTFQIIPSIRRLSDLEAGLNSQSDIVLLTEAHIANLKDLVKIAHQKNKLVLVNLELVGGFGKDQIGIKLMKNYYQVDGVMSTDQSKLNLARHNGLFTIQRFFLHDSRALETSLRLLEKSTVDAAELLPSKIAIDFIEKISSVTDIPLLAGGFIHDQQMIKVIRESGFSGMTVSDKTLW
ncbi:glycerol-3-phosphate responsive antiterminator [Eubacteriaceae bacterium ES3]|nr:glycerol-3-phosphate responsive antiterminator [Eubacteriaceae bacterium ES3]